MSEATTDDAKALVRRFVEITNSGKHELLREIVHRDVVRHSQSTPGVEVRSREALGRFLRQDAVTFPDGQMRLDRLVAEGQCVAFYGEYTGTQRGPMGPFPATGKSVAVAASGLFRLSDGKIAEFWILWDNLALLTQLGHLAPPQSTPG